MTTSTVTTAYATPASPLPPAFVESRRELQRVAVHILARRRKAATGRIGLRPAPAGIATPAFGDELEVVRLSGTHLVHELGGRARVAPLTTLGDAARLLDLDLDAPLSVGHDTPPVGDRKAPLVLDEPSLELIAGWYQLVQVALDAIVAELPRSAAPSAAQLWPEHFDLACDLAWGSGERQRVNVGGSPGDDTCPEPYAYLGPWDAVRPGEPAFWNVPFGALLPRSALGDVTPAAAVERITRFFRQGIALLTA